jgi:hypothetical protein
VLEQTFRASSQNYSKYNENSSGRKKTIAFIVRCNALCGFLLQLRPLQVPATQSEFGGITAVLMAYENCQCV